MKELIEQLEAATHGSRELDDQIAHAIGWKQNYHGDDSRGYWLPRYITWTRPDGAQLSVGEMPPPYSQFLDAALTLYKEKPKFISTNPLIACIEALQQWS